MTIKSALSAVFAFTLVTIATCCGIGKYLPTSCTLGSQNTQNLPLQYTTWQIDIDITAGQVIWFDAIYPFNQALRSTISDFSNMYHVVMVSGGGYFDLNVDNSFLKTKYSSIIVSFPSSTRVNFGIGMATRIIGEKITTTSVTSYQLTFSSVGSFVCFGLISVPDINTVTFDGGDYQTHWGPCAGAMAGSKWPTGSIDFVCPCGNCNSACTKCFGTSSTQCTACSSGYYLQPSSTSCQISCPPGYWKDDTNRICTACHSACSACSGPNSNQCSTCNPGYFLQGTTCAACHLACSVCTGALDSQCSACKTNYYLQPEPSDTTCLDSCPSIRYWPDPATNTCEECHSFCSECSGPNSNECSSCSSGYFLQGASTCIACHPACSVCTGSLDSQCSACKTNYYLQPSPSETTCLDSCPDGYWPDDLTNKCQTCHASCSICTGAENTVCTACKSGFFLQPSSATCSDSCPAGYGGESATNTCVQCHTSCSDCTGPNPDQCSTCNLEFFLQPSGTICLSTCPAGYWQDETNHICASCDISCSQCTGSLNTQCSACNSGYILQPSSNTCLKGPTSCSDGLYLFHNSSCVASCPSGSYPNTTDYKCYEDCQTEVSKCQQMDGVSAEAVSQISTITKAAAPAIGVGLLGSQAVMGGTSETLASSTNAIHLQLLLRYIDAGYPPNVESFFDLTSRNASSNDSSAIPELFLVFKVGNLSQYQSSWYRFGEYKLSVNFLTNCGTAVITCFCCLVISGILILVKRNVKPKAAWFNGILYRFKWNLILSCVISNQSKLILGWFLQYSGPKFDTYGIINLIIAAISLLGVIILTIISIKHAKWNWKITQDRLLLSKAALEAAESSQKQFAFVTDDYVAENPIGRYYFIISIFKVLSTVAIIFWLPLSSIAQAYLLLFWNIFFLLVLIIGKPYKDLDKKVLALSNEILMVLQEVIVAIFATDRLKNFLSYKQWMNFGWVFIGIVLLSLVINALFPIFTVVKALVISWREKKKKSKRTQARVRQRVITQQRRGQGRPYQQRNNPEPRKQTLNQIQNVNDSRQQLRSERSNFLD